jgi:hypothetical protein
VIAVRQSLLAVQLTATCAAFVTSRIDITPAIRAARQNLAGCLRLWLRFFRKPGPPARRGFLPAIARLR